MKKIKLLSALALALGVSSSFAGSATTSFAIGTTVTANCTVSSSTGISFASYGSASDVTGTGTFSVQCTNTTAWTMAANKGSSTSGTISSRLMSNGAATLGYNVYKDSGYSTLFGDGVTGQTVAGTGNGNVQTTTIYGKIPAGSYPTPGSYSDTITLSLSY